MAFDNLENQLKKYAEAYTQKYKSKLISDGNKASGKLVNSVKPKMLKNGFSILAKSYIEQISEGRRVGRIPPSNEILEWAKAKKIKPEKGPDTESNRKRMAFAIARSIGMHGMLQKLGFKGTGIIDFVYNSLSREMGEDLFEAYRQDLEEQLKEQVK
jgi:hypothetical protein